MKNPNEFDTILDECLERVIAGESVEACLTRYPEHAEELRPLLTTAFAANEAADITPRPEFRQEAARQFQQALQSLPVKKPAGTFSFRHWWVTAVVVLAVVVFGGGGTVFAANSAQPNSFLYPVKLTTENVRLSLAGSDQSKAKLYAEFAQRRVNEIVAMAAKGDAAGVERATNHLDNQLVAMAGVVGGENAAGAAAQENAEGTLRSSAATTAMPMALPSATATTTVTPTTTTPAALAVPAPTPVPPAGTTTLTQPAPSAATAEPKVSGTVTPGRGGESFEADVSNQAAEATQKLQEALNNAPESARKGLEHALEVVTNGYGNVLHGLHK